MGTVRPVRSSQHESLVALAFLAVASASREKLLRSEQCSPDETECPAGCCPEANWYCCPDNMYCAAMKQKVMKMAANKQCGPDETECPAGCCPEANWFCCPDNMYCAATSADCPFVAKKQKVMKMAANKQCGPDETE